MFDYNLQDIFMHYNIGHRCQYVWSTVFLIISGFSEFNTKFLWQENKYKAISCGLWKSNIKNNKNEDNPTNYFQLYPMVCYPPKISISTV